jgi:hypothetical protein
VLPQTRRGIFGNINHHITDGGLMQFGQLSNVVAPKIYIVFDDSIGTLPSGKVKQYGKFLERGQYRKAFDCFTLDHDLLHKILDLGWRCKYNIALVTWQPQGIADEITCLMDDLSYPVSGCVSTDPLLFADGLKYAPHVMSVYASGPENLVNMGSKGKLISDLKYL